MAEIPIMWMGPERLCAIDMYLLQIPALKICES